ncbi:AraC family transcriptional regulator [Amycolatopsis deserti]|uniref:AraC family transcriptional regulator n=1 Tax=Amycolatopsis deserti TaxID=185696 RepID=UPI0017492ECD|nr:helix-turn-helix transcriptional regulator [Amycolatopsis deserti]
MEAAEPVLGRHELIPQGGGREIDLRLRTHTGTQLRSAILNYGCDVVVRLAVPRSAYITTIVLGGRCVCRVDDVYLEAGAGSVVTVSPKQRFGFQVTGACSLKVVRIEPRAMHMRLARITGDWPPSPIHFRPVITGLAGRGQPLLTSAERFFGRPKSRFARHSDEVFVDWLLRHQPHEYSDAIWRRCDPVVTSGASDFAKVLLRADPRGEVSMADLARLAGVSLDELTLSFRAHEGCLPHEYLRRVRLDCVRLLLVAATEELMTVDEAARRYGFRDNQQFRIWYLDRFGEWPVETLRRPLG